MITSVVKSGVVNGIRSCAAVLPVFARALSFGTRSHGEPGGEDYSVRLLVDGQPGSFWHDVPLIASPQQAQNNTRKADVVNDASSMTFEGYDDIPDTPRECGVESGLNPPVLNMVIEIPQGSTAKMEVRHDFDMGIQGENPIVQDRTKKGALRFLRHSPMPFDYGAFPRTWEDPFVIAKDEIVDELKSLSVVSEETKRFQGLIENDPRMSLPGDGDPVDVILVGSKSPSSSLGVPRVDTESIDISENHRKNAGSASLEQEKRDAEISWSKDAMSVRGSIARVIPIGSLALIDEGEIDWKVIAVSENDPTLADNDVSDLHKVFSDDIDRVREWFRVYKTAEGKGINEYGFDGILAPREITWAMLKSTHRMWANKFAAQDKIEFP